MKVLVPVDGSLHSTEALKVALDFVKIKGAEIYVISIVPNISDGVVDLEIPPGMKERHMNGIEDRANVALKSACNFLGEHEVTTSCAKTVLTAVSVPDAIIDFAESEKIDLIIMGSRGLSPSSRISLGSVAAQVVRYSPCSVHLVKARSGL